MAHNNIRFAALVICLAALALLGGNPTLAGASEPGASLPAQTFGVTFGGGGPGPVDNWFTYQGYLQDNGTPVSDTCDFQFSLWDSSGTGVPPTGGIQIGTTETAGSLLITEGLFNYTLNTGDEFGPQAFNGQRRYLQIAARCPAGSGGYTTLAPRQLLTGAPYALSLRPGAVISDTQNSALLTVINTNAVESGSGAIVARGSGPTAPVIGAHHAGIGHALYGSSDSGYPTIGGVNLGSGSAVNGRSAGGIGVYGLTETNDSVGVAGLQSGSAFSLSDLGGYWKPGGYFIGRNGVVGITKTNAGYGVFGWDKSESSGWAGYFFSANGNGVYVSAPNVGLNVAGGTKNAVVRTESGSRLMYSEESTEVWFSDYGFGQLESGSADIAIDPIFAQTVNLKEPYHVFVQAYADAELYVSNRSATGFEVHLRDGEANAEFSYRIVAQRLGYEETRLDRAPWADNDPNLYPEKANEAMQTPQGGQP